MPVVISDKTTVIIFEPESEKSCHLQDTSKQLDERTCTAGILHQACPTRGFPCWNNGYCWDNSGEHWIVPPGLNFYPAGGQETPKK